MKIISPYHIIKDRIDGVQILKKLELIGRVCWKSEGRITDDSYERFIKILIERGHEAIIEHESITVVFICDRGVTHEIVRHRIASYAMESTRYCNYSNDKFDNELTFIRPYYWATDSQLYDLWEQQMLKSEDTYLKMIELGATPEEARSILPNSLKTELVVTMNLREWRHFFKLRTASVAHPQMREVVIPLANEFKNLIPIIFQDIVYNDLSVKSRTPLVSVVQNPEIKPFSQDDFRKTGY